VLSNFKFANTYRYWNSGLNMPLPEAIYICDSDDQTAFAFLKEDFKTIKLLDTIQFSNKITVRNLYIYKVNN
jgi:hypothetical protein